MDLTAQPVYGPAILAYLAATEIVAPPGKLFNKAHAPGGATVNLEDLAQTLFAATFLGLRDEGSLRLEPFESRRLFLRSEEVTAVRTGTTGFTSGLEAELFACIEDGAKDPRRHNTVSAVIARWYGKDVLSPQALVMRRVYNEARELGLLVGAERGTVGTLLSAGAPPASEVPAERRAEVDAAVGSFVARWRAFCADEVPLYALLKKGARAGMAARQYQAASGDSCSS